ncbi:CapA family protein, partial [Escherichia coli]|nr:CapA family protein [Escherichia coli]
ETDLDRCLALLDDPDIMPSMYGQILWGDQYAHLPEPRIVDLAHRLLSMPNGDDVILEALSMKLSDQKDGSSTLGFDLLQIGLKAAIQRFKREHNDSA